MKAFRELSSKAGQSIVPGTSDGQPKAVRRSLREGWGRRLVRRLFWSAGFVCIVASLVVFCRSSRQSTKDFLVATQSARQTRAGLATLGGIRVRLGTVESAARSFAISMKQQHLNPLYTATAEIPQELDELKRLLQEQPEQMQILAGIEPVIAKHLAVMKEMVELGTKNIFRSIGQRGLTDEGHALMEQIQIAFSQIEKEQRVRLDQQQAAATLGADRVARINWAGSIWATLLVLVCGAVAVRAVRERGKAEEKLNQLLGSMPDAIVIVNAEGKIVGNNVHAEKLFGYSSQELHGQSMAMLVPERLRQAQRQYYTGCFAQRGEHAPATILELCALHKDGQEFPIEVSTKPLVAEKGLLVTSAIRDVTQRKQTEQKISRLHKELEQRAAELEAANKELEAFSYSVSHDLRSPLQNIDSFSQILMEDYANRLDADGRDYVQRLRGSCERMEEIIEALLVLSNMMRTELRLENVDLSSLTQAIAADLQQKNPDRLVDWVIAKELTAYGDRQLLQVVLENLLGNAWKFTASRAHARIEFGALPQSNGTPTYFVRDDGAGFDMARVDSLFTPFKRLHDQSEFRGTGIGLATVQRVIQRHQGKIWAEGQVDNGATFCFNLSAKGTNGNGHSDSPAEGI